MQYKIEYLDSKNNFRHTEVQFTQYEQALEWGRSNLPNFNLDMIKVIF